MKKKLLFATSNAHKLKEILSIAPPELEIVSLEDIGFTGELPETQDSIEGNSLQKAEFLFQNYGISCFSEDTGLIIPSINGEPGVYSARYAGEGASFDDNIEKVLTKMARVDDRLASFKTVITYYSNGEYVQFSGITEGEILRQRQGDGGFGYDPIFRPLGSDKTYSQMSMEEKNSFSHRKKSFDLFANHLKQISVLPL